MSERARYGGISERTLRAAGHLLVGLYPLAWRARYGEEMHALLDDDPPSLRRAATLVHGAARAHLRPGARSSLAPSLRIRLSISAVFMCWMAVSLAGAGFQKETEEPPFAAAAGAHPLLQITREVIIAGAIVGAATIALGGLPLLWNAFRTAYSRRDRRLAALLALPAAAAFCFTLVSAAGVAIASRSAGPVGRPPFGVALVWQATGIACLAACALAPRLVLVRVEPPSWMLRLAAVAAVPLAAAMIAIACALAAYDAELYLKAPGLAATSGGPVQPSTGVTLVAGALLAGLSAAVALLAARRARRAASLAAAR